jgi:hypothetical protein
MTSDEIQEERKKVYATTRQDLLTRNLSNSEKYDNAILTLSTGLLGVSLAFIKDIVPLDKSQYVCLLELSWWLFGTSIVSTLVSFVVSQLAIKRQLQYAMEYYLEGKEESFTKKNLPASLTEYINYASGAFFIAGIVATVWFVSANIKGGDPMAKKVGSATVSGIQKVETATVKVTTKKGATVPEMQPVPATETSQQTIGSQGTGSGGSTGKKKQ